MSSLPNRCPACSDALDVTHLRCPSCEMSLEGRFELHPLMRLPPEDLEFVLTFVKASGSLKEMAKTYGQSYPTIRNRLDNLIQQLDHSPTDVEKRRHAILDAIARGELSVKEGARKLQEVEK